MTSSPVPRFTQVATVFVPVSDQDRAIAFYVERLGFEQRSDFGYGRGEHRWVEVAPPGSTFALALVAPSEGVSPPSNVTRCALLSEDIEADHAALLALRVDVDPGIARAGTQRTGLVSLEVSVQSPVPAQFFFRDPDGNRFLVVQPS